MKQKIPGLWIRVIILTALIGVLGYFTAKSKGLFAVTNTAAALSNESAVSNDTPALSQPVPEQPAVKERKISLRNLFKGIMETSGIFAFFTETEEYVTYDVEMHGQRERDTRKVMRKETEITPEGKKIKVLTDNGLSLTLSEPDFQKSRSVSYGWQKAIMILIGFTLLFLGIGKGFEPLLLVPIGFGTLLVNMPLAGMGDAPHGFLRIIFDSGIKNELFPLIIFMGVGALTDFGPLIANPKTALLGAAAQFGIFGTLLGAVAITQIPGINFTMADACAISIIGGADGPTSIYVASKLAPAKLGSIAVAAYSYMALVPLIQPPIMRLLTSKKERMIRMKQLRHVSKIEKIIFPLIVLTLSALLLPSAVPLMGALTFGNLVKESGVVERLSKTLQNELINIVTIFLGLGVGMQMAAYKFMQLESLGILLLGLVAFSFGTMAGILFGKLMNKLSKDPINPLIGAAGVSAVPMAARVANKVGMDEDPNNILMMHAMGPNVSGVIGSAIAAGVMIALFM